MIKWLATWLLLCGVAVGQVAFNGTNSIVSINQESFAVSNSFTVSTWVKWNEDLSITQASSIYSREESSALRSFYVFLYRSERSGNPYVYRFVLSGDGTAFYVVDYLWSFSKTLHHVAFVYDDAFGTGTNAFRCYVDGQPLEIFYHAGTYQGGFFAGNRKYSVASNRFPPVQNADALFYDLRVYSRSLSENEVSIISNPKTAYELIDPDALYFRTCVNSGDTGNALTGTCRNYGTGADGTYSNSPTVPPFKIPAIPPMEEDQP